MKVNTKKKITSPKPLTLRIKVSDYMVNSTPRPQQQQISLKASGSKTPKPLKNWYLINWWTYNKYIVMSREEDFDYLFKIVIIGDSGVGKTNLLARFID